MGKLRGNLSFANVVSVISLFFALGLAGAWAATELNRNEVKSKHIGKGQVKSGDLASDSVTSPKVANGSLLGEDFAAAQLPAGPPGEQGQPGQDATNLFAYVRDDGSGFQAVLEYGVGALSVSDQNGPNGALSPYVVTFDRDLSGCVAHATQGNGEPNGGSNTVPTGAANADVEGSTVRTFSLNPAGTAADSAFMVSVFC